MSDGPSTPKRIRLDNDEILSLTQEELIDKFHEQNEYVRYLESKRSIAALTGDDDDGHESEGKLRQHNMEGRRENTLVLRLANKEQELQDCLNQITEMKQAHSQNTAQLRAMMLDPALNLIFQRMSKEVDDSKDKLKQTQNELSAWKFTPDSQTGKRLMAKCRMLLQENEELGKMIASGRTAKLEGEIALQKTLVQEMKKNQQELDEFVAELEEDVEGMQCMIYLLQTQLKETKEHLAKVQAENVQLLVNKRTSSDNDPGGTETKVLEDIKLANKKHSPSKPVISENGNKDISTISGRHSEIGHNATVDSLQVNSESLQHDNEPMQVDKVDGSVQSHILTADSTSSFETTGATTKSCSPRNSKNDPYDSNDAFDSSPQTLKKNTGGWSPKKETRGWSPKKDTGSWSPKKDTGSWSPKKDTGVWSPNKNTEGWSPKKETGGWSPKKETGGWSPKKDTGRWSPPESHNRNNRISDQTNDSQASSPLNLKKDNENHSPKHLEHDTKDSSSKHSAQEPSHSPKNLTNDTRTWSPKNSEENNEAMDLSNCRQDSEDTSVRNSLRDSGDWRPSISEKSCDDWSPDNSTKDVEGWSPLNRTKDTGDASPENPKSEHDIISVEDTASRTDNKPISESNSAHTDVEKTILNGVEPLTQSESEAD